MGLLFACILILAFPTIALVESRMKPSHKPALPLRIPRVSANAIAVIAAIASATAALFSLSISQHQVAEMEADRRPWIKVQVDVDSDFQLDDVGGVIPLQYSVVNVGKSPAFDVRISAWSFAGRAWDSKLFDFHRKTCSAYAEQRSLDQEQKWVVFPDDHIRWDGSLGQSVPGYRPEDMKKISFVDADGLKKAFITFVGCVDYLSPSDAKHHQTAFTFEIQQLVMFQGVKARSLAVLIGHPIPAKELLLVRHPSPVDLTN